MMLPIIKIGLTYTGSLEKHNNYVQWLKANNQIEIVTLSEENQDLESIKNLDGIVLSGGVDVQPKYYNSTVVNYPNSPETFNEKRDTFEIAVFNISQQKNIPLLAVCRGMQLMNCILGGTLIQDLGEQSNMVHRFHQQDKAHGINTISGTLLNEITGVERTITNSAHHQAIKELSNQLKVNCISDDGIIEGVEWADKENKSFVLGIQWHPERMYKFNLADAPASKNIRDYFINEVKKSIENLV